MEVEEVNRSQTKLEVELKDFVIHLVWDVEKEQQGRGGGLQSFHLEQLKKHNGPTDLGKAVSAGERRSGSLGVKPYTWKGNQMDLEVWPWFSCGGIYD